MTYHPKAAITLEEVRKFAPSTEKLKLEAAHSDGVRESWAFIPCSVKSPSCVATEPRWIRVETLKEQYKHGRAIAQCIHCAQYKGGYIDKSGYHYYEANGEAISVHREVIEKRIGRKLTTQESVHHRNGRRADNRPSNLQLRFSGRHPKGLSPSDLKHTLETTFPGVRVVVPEKWRDDFKA
jgi:hypothetical protein